MGHGADIVHSILVSPRHIPAIPPALFECGTSCRASQAKLGSLGQEPGHHPSVYLEDRHVSPPACGRKQRGGLSQQRDKLGTDLELWTGAADHRVGSGHWLDFKSWGWRIS